MYGLRSDGSDKKWDIQKKASHKLAVNHIDFSLPLGGTAIDEAAEESGKTIERHLLVLWRGAPIATCRHRDIAQVDRLLPLCVVGPFDLAGARLSRC
jgi:hypothetical protein